MVYDGMRWYTIVCDGIRLYAMVYDCMRLTYTMVYDCILAYTLVYNRLWYFYNVTFLQRDIFTTNLSSGKILLTNQLLMNNARARSIIIYYLSKNDLPLAISGESPLMVLSNDASTPMKGTPMSNQLQNNIRNGLNDHLAQFEASRDRLRAIHNAERESRAKARKRRAILQTVSDLIQSVFMALGIFTATAIVITVLLFMAFGFTAPDGFGIQLPFGGYFWESIQ